MNDRFLLYVEGKDDLAVSCQLALKRDELCEPKGKDPRAPRFKVEQYDTDGHALHGVDALIRVFPTLLKSTSAERLGFVVDADDDVSARWQSIRNHLLHEGYASAPSAPELLGTIVELENRPRVGIWIWPDNQAGGMLEHFIESMIPTGDVLLPHANFSVDEATRIDRRFPAGHRQKAVIHTWLAWQKKTGAPQGIAIREGFLDAATELAVRYIDWLIRLFG